MNNLEEIYSKYTLNPVRFTIKNNAKIIDTDKGCFVIKEKKGSNLNELERYLNSRSFNYLPRIISEENDKYDISEYIKEINIPDEQKASDIISLLSLLHNKTTFYKEIDSGEYKKIYEEIDSKINYLFNYYNDLITIIEDKVYMSPSEYLLARNISKIFATLYFCKNEIKSWYNIVKDKKKMRFVTNHNNISLDHLVRGETPYLVSWNKSKTDLPIFDFMSFYNKGYHNLNYNELLNQYEEKYPLFEEEKKLLFVLISIPDKIDFTNEEYYICKKINFILNKIYRSENLLTPYYSNHQEIDETNL